MAFDKREEKTWRNLQLKVRRLEKASSVRDSALEQLAEHLGVEIDLTRMPTEEQERAAEMTRKSSKRLLQSEEVIAYLSETEEDDTH